MNYYKAFRKAKTCSDRAFFLIEWIHSTMNRVARNSNKMSAIQAQQLILSSELESHRFCGRDIIPDYVLVEGWFRNFYAQASTHYRTEELFKVLNWDYHSAKNPVFTDEMTIEYIKLREASGDIEVGLLLRSSLPIPIGSLWKNIRSNKRWRVVDCIDGVAELELFDSELIVQDWYRSGFHHNIFRNFSNLNRLWKRVKV